jgi:hypothetical protein
VIDPQVMPEQPLPVTLHITTPLCGPLAENWICPLSFTWGVAGEMVSFDVDTIVAVAWPDSP